MSPNNLCRLCVSFCSLGKSLYDNDGQQNELYSIVFNYFHPKILDLCQEKHLKFICHKCWQSIDDFQKFQSNVEMAQLKFMAKDKHQEDKVERQMDQFEILEVDQSHMNLKIENEEQQVSATPYKLDIKSDSVKDELEDFSGLEHCGLSQTNQDNNDIIDCNASDNSSFDDEMPISSCYSKTTEELQAGVESAENLARLNEMIVRFMVAVKCAECTDCFVCYNEYRQHFRLQHPHKEFHFECCQRKFKSQSKVVEHLLLHNDPEAFKCRACCKSFATNSSLYRHMAMAHADSLDQKYACEYCDKAFITLKNLNVHRTKKHMTVKKIKVLKPDADGLFRCADCNYCSPSQSNYSTHRWYIHNPSNSFKCAMCQKSFKRATLLQAHMERHANGSAVESEYAPYRCDICLRRFKYEQSLKVHKDNMHPLDHEEKRGTQAETSLSLPLLYPCNMCSKSFKIYKSLTQHQRRNHFKKSKPQTEVNVNQGPILATGD
uniref:C2H2-type domain-containing protein n=1 Tax=Stomoxys calcitrans TaxID=35570 RepID=A0A1I8PGM5_STOCA